jgi:hypothetical protein
MTTPMQETETFVQALQRFHDTLTTTQQRMLQTILNRVTQTATATGTTPEVQGYAATTGPNWTVLTRWLNTTLTTTGTPGRPGTTGTTPTT